MTTTETIAQPVRNWEEAVMRTCEFCVHYKMTALNSDGSSICAACCDAEYVTNLLNAIEIYQARNAELVEALERAQQIIAELEAQMTTIKMSVAATAEGRRYLLKALETCKCSPIPEGYALVPLEPTRQMMSQGHFAMARSGQAI
ncbi:hypothetical protein [Atlantibacter hermannii]|uniref:hypothetical protein n=1 Tax=Atlantibacter hermannii TaxID=565 RepID=UPI00290EDE19|nr:hypothetical protein [Atlantibacter hermannii]MDU7382422.1 hypothetical protein [Enterobacteriaceae bacterium]MDU7390860.1 hypothetical protein [Atlantibacter hermannii]